MQRRTTTIILAGGIGATLAIASSMRSARGRNLRRRTRRWEHKTAGRLQGWAQRMDYVLNDGHPDPDVSDLVLTDRIRSTIGPLEKQLDLPRIHVMVNDRTALLHGDVARLADAAMLEHAVGAVSGVKGVESFLHIGLIASDTRPSDGRASPQPPSDALTALLETARSVGAGHAPANLVRAVLSVFLEAVQHDEKRHVLSHLPDDVRRLADPPRRAGLEPQRIRTTQDLFDAIANSDPDLDRSDVERATIEILAGLARLVPEEVHDLDASLPHELSELWQRAHAVPDEAAVFAQAFLRVLERL